MFKQQKGITLIALIITIIVLLILAGVTIAMLTGTDSAPVKANEAKQKQDIGAAKDQVMINVAEYQTNAYDLIYVQGLPASGTAGANGTQTAGASNKKDEIGTLVGNAVQGTAIPKTTTSVTNLNNQQIGLAKIVTSAPDTGDTTHTAKIVISTTDFQITGYIQQAGGALVWDAAGIITKE